MKNETARREIESLDYYLQNHTNDYSEKSHTAMMMAIEALEQETRKGEWIDLDWKPAPNGVPVEKCGNCGEWSTQMGKNFCPSCGAKMSRYER